MNTKFGYQENTAVGYNPHKPVRRSLHPLVSSIAGTRLALHMEWGKGSIVSAPDWIAAMEKVWSHPLARERIKLNRGDIGFSQEKIIAWHENTQNRAPQYLFKLKFTKNVKRAIPRVNWPDWERQLTEGFEKTAEIELQLQGWSNARRVVVSRSLKPLNPSAQDDFWGLSNEIIHAYVTDLSIEQATGFQIVAPLQTAWEC